MKVENNLIVSVTEDEKQIINAFNNILAEIKVQVQDYKDNGHIPFIDDITYPRCLERTKAIFEALNQIYD